MSQGRTTSDSRLTGARPFDQSLLQAVVDNTDNALLVLDSAHRVIYYNRRYLDMWGFSASVLDEGPTIEDLIRHACDRGLYPTEQADALIRRRRELLGAGEPRTVIETPRLDGIVVEGYATALPEGGYLLTYRDITERLRTQEALVESQARYRGMMEAMQDLVYIYSADLRIEYMNPAMVNVVGREALGEACFAVMHGRQTPCSWCPAPRVTKEGRSWQWEGVRPLDGRTYSVSSVPLAHSDGRVSGLAVIRDVTDRRTAEQAVRAQMEFTRSLIQSSAAATFVVDRDHLVRFWNRACEELTGIPAESIVGTDEQWRAFYPAPRPCLADLIVSGETARLGELYPVWGQAAFAAEGLHAEGWYDNLGGQRRYIVFDAAPIRGADGETIAAVETIQDFTIHQKAKEELTLLARAVDQAVEAVVVTDPAFRSRYLNPAGQRITGYSLSEYQGQDLRHVLCEGQEGQPQVRVEQALERGQAWSGPLRIRHKDGSWRKVECSISPVCDDAGIVVNWVALLHDVTRQADLEHHLALSQKLTAIGTLAGGIAHDFNNLLTAILGYAEMALDSVDQGSPAARDLGRVLQAGERARDLVAQILAFSRQEAVGRRPVGLSHLVLETLDFLRASTPSSVEFRCPPPTPEFTVTGDPSQLQQVILNLCTNAVQAIGDQAGTVTVALDAAEGDGTGASALLDLGPGTYVRLQVADTGCGVATEMLPRIFDPFFTTKEVGQGTGLGLSVVHGIVTAHRGAVSVESAPGQGTRVSVYLPHVGTAAPVGATAQAVGTLDGCGRVLVVDDEPLVAELLEDMLRDLGYAPEVAGGGEEALELLESDPSRCDLLLTDRSMPRLTGEDLIRRALALRPDLPVVLITGFSDADAHERFRKLGVREVILKPVRRSDLAEALVRALGGRDQTAERG
ncbi:MAG: PAS domain S-box protein [Proteobacteria bacterium]|nr:PAS domain S-box protein [Pseudomonadota bacterium]